MIARTKEYDHLWIIIFVTHYESKRDIIRVRLRQLTSRSNDTESRRSSVVVELAGESVRSAHKYLVVGVEVQFIIGGVGAGEHLSSENVAMILHRYIHRTGVSDEVTVVLALVITFPAATGDGYCSTTLCIVSIISGRKLSEEVTSQSQHQDSTQQTAHSLGHFENAGNHK